MGSGDLVRRMYADFRGVDFRGGEVDLRRSPDSLNMWKDYRNPDGIRKRPYMVERYGPPIPPGGGGVPESNPGDGPIYSIDFCNFGEKQETLVVSGTNLYVWGKSPGRGLLLQQFAEPGNGKCTTFVFDNVWYLKGSYFFLQYDGTDAKKVEGYAPTTSIKRTPAGGGEPYQDVNLLTRRRKNTFVGDGESTEFYVDTNNLDTNEEVIVTVNGEVVEIAAGPGGLRIYKDSVILTEAPPKPLTDGQDNVCIEFSVLEENEWPYTARNKIDLCRIATVFDNRVFYSGNPYYPNTVWHSSMDDPTYVSDLDYYIEGQDNAPVKAMVPGNNALWVFKEPSQEHNSIFYHVPTIDSDYGKIYPSTHSNVSTGCVATGTNFNDDIVFFSDKGMEGIAGEVTTEQVVAHRSSMVDAKLVAEENYKNMILEEWNGYLLVIIGNKVYLADSRAMCQIDNHYEYEWYYWKLGYNVTCTRVHDGVLYLGCDDGVVYTLNENAGLTYDLPEAYWTTPLDKFANPQYLKTTNKRGCVIEASGNFDVYVKTNKSDWERVGEVSDVDDYRVCRIKRKKFKDIQLKFRSPQRPPRDFVLESATLECYIGGYIKR